MFGIGDDGKVIWVHISRQSSGDAGSIRLYGLSETQEGARHRVRIRRTLQRQREAAGGRMVSVSSLDINVFVQTHSFPLPRLL